VVPFPQSVFPYPASLPEERWTRSLGAEGHLSTVPLPLPFQSRGAVEPEHWSKPAQQHMTTKIGRLAAWPGGKADSVFLEGPTGTIHSSQRAKAPSFLRAPTNHAHQPCPPTTPTTTGGDILLVGWVGGPAPCIYGHGVGMYFFGLGGPHTQHNSSILTNLFLEEVSPN